MEKVSPHVTSLSLTPHFPVRRAEQISARGSCPSAAQLVHPIRAGSSSRQWENRGISRQRFTPLSSDSPVHDKIFISPMFSSGKCFPNPGQRCQGCPRAGKPWAGNPPGSQHKGVGPQCPLGGKNPHIFLRNPFLRAYLSNKYFTFLMCFFACHTATTVLVLCFSYEALQMSFLPFKLFILLLLIAVLWKSEVEKTVISHNVHTQHQQNRAAKSKPAGCGGHGHHMDILVKLLTQQWEVFL